MSDLRAHKRVLSALRREAQVEIFFKDGVECMRLIHKPTGVKVEAEVKGPRAAVRDTLLGLLFDKLSKDRAVS